MTNENPAVSTAPGLLGSNVTCLIIFCTAMTIVCCLAMVRSCCRRAHHLRTLWQPSSTTSVGGYIWPCKRAHISYETFCKDVWGAFVFKREAYVLSMPAVGLKPRTPLLSILLLALLRFVVVDQTEPVPALLAAVRRDERESIHCM